MPYGLRVKDSPTILVQISGGGRVELRRYGRAWWGDPTLYTWEAYETDEGQTYDTQADAEQVAKNLETR